MTVKTVVDYTAKEITTLIDALSLMHDICHNDDINDDIKQEADQAFACMAELIILDPDGEREFEQYGW